MNENIEVIAVDRNEDGIKVLDEAYFELVQKGIEDLQTIKELRTKAADDLGNTAEFAARVSDRVVGAIRLVAQSGGAAKVFEMGVSPKFQRQGVGTRLLQQAEDHARKNGCKTLELQASRQAYNLLHFYSKRGFTKKPEQDIADYSKLSLVKQL